MKPKHRRLIALIAGVACVFTGVAVVLKNFNDNIVYFYSPTEVKQKPLMQGKTVRVGGLVMSKSVEKLAEHTTRFTITDQVESLPVEYTGLLPNLFREGQGVVVEGVLDTNGTMKAKTVLAKHDENYMPKEVVDALKKSGRWKEGEK